MTILNNHESCYSHFSINLVLGVGLEVGLLVPDVHGEAEDDRGGGEPGGRHPGQGHCGGSVVSSPPPASSLTSLCPLLPSPHTPAAWPQLCACADWQKAASPRAWAQPHCSQQRPSICPPPGRHYPPAGHTALELCPVVFSSKNTSAAAGDSVRVSLCRVPMVAAAALLLLEAAAASTLYTGTTSGHSPHPPSPHTLLLLRGPKWQHYCILHFNEAMRMRTIIMQ